MGSVKEDVDNYLRTEMVTLGTNIDDAKTGQMWAFDSERLSKGVLSLVCKRIEGAKLKDRKINMAMMAGLIEWRNNIEAEATPESMVDYMCSEVARVQLQAILDVIKEE
jgi:hypothetical protein